MTFKPASPGKRTGACLEYGAARRPTFKSDRRITVELFHYTSPSVPGMKNAPRPGHLCSAVILYNHSKTRRSPALRRRPGRRDKLACFLRPAHQDVLLHQPPALSGHGPGGCHGLAELIAAAHREAAPTPPARRAGRTTARGFSPCDGRQKKREGAPGTFPFAV